MFLFRLLSPGRMLLVVTLIVAGYLFVSAGGGVLQTYRLATDEARLRQAVETLQGEQEQLEQIRDYLRSNEYIEFMARRVFGLVKPGESLVTVEAPTPAEDPDEAPGRTWWQRLFGQ